jgi:hypothetical protein
MHIKYTQGNKMANRDFSLKLGVMDLILIAGIGYVGYQNIGLRNDIDAITTFIEETSKLADEKIAEMAMATYQASGALDRADYRNSKKIEYGVGTVGALRLTGKVKDAVGDVAKIVVTADEANNQYQVAIGEHTYVATADEKYLIINNISIPLDKDEYRLFKESIEFEKLGKMIGEDTQSYALNEQYEDTNPVGKLPQVSNPQVVDQASELLIKELFPIGLPGIASSFGTLAERKDVLEQAAPYMLKYEGVNAHTTLYVAFDISCPYCREFYKAFPELQEAGFTLNLMMMDKTRKYTSKNAKVMQTLYCKENPVDALNKTMRGDEPTPAPCDKGVQFLESMTNAAILAGTQATPSLFTVEGIPLYTYNEDKNKYLPEYRLPRIQSFLEKINSYK